MDVYIATKRKVINVTVSKERFQPVQFSLLILCKKRVRGSDWSKSVTFQFRRGRQERAL